MVICTLATFLLFIHSPQIACGEDLILNEAPELGAPDRRMDEFGIEASTDDSSESDDDDYDYFGDGSGYASAEPEITREEFDDVESNLVNRLGGEGSGVGSGVGSGGRRRVEDGERRRFTPQNNYRRGDLIYSGTKDLGARIFNWKFRASNGIILRECPTCPNSHKTIYYKRIKNVDTFKAYDCFVGTWRKSCDGVSNVLNVDFELYSSESDLRQGTNKWSFCNYDGNTIGFPRDCGPLGPVGWAWSSKVDPRSKAVSYYAVDKWTGHQFVGCYVDDDNRDLGVYKGHGQTEGTCRHMCRYHKFFALQFFGQCWCGDAYGTRAGLTPDYVQRPEGECGSNGRAWRNRVYRTSGKKDRFTAVFISDLETRYRGHGHHQARMVMEYIRDIGGKNIQYDDNVGTVQPDIVIHGGDINEDGWSCNKDCHETGWCWSDARCQPVDREFTQVWNTLYDAGIPAISSWGNHDFQNKRSVYFESHKKYSDDQNKKTLEFTRKTFEKAAATSSEFKYTKYSPTSGRIGPDAFKATFRGLQIAMFQNTSQEYEYDAGDRSVQISPSGAALAAALDRNDPAIFVSHVPARAHVNAGNTFMNNLIPQFENAHHFSGHTHSVHFETHTVTPGGVTRRFRDFTAPYPWWYGSKEWAATKWDCPEMTQPMTQEFMDCSRKNGIYPGFLALLVDPDYGVVEVKIVEIVAGKQYGEQCGSGSDCTKSCFNHKDNFEWWSDSLTNRCGRMKTPVGQAITGVVHNVLFNQCMPHDTMCAGNCDKCCNGHEWKWKGFSSFTYCK